MPAPNRPHLFATPEDAENAFYEALERGDSDALIATWSEDEDTVCIHPTGVQLSGLSLIRDSWRSIFDNSQLRVSATLMAQWHSAILAVHHLIEAVFVGDDQAPHGPLFVTHVYSRGSHGWRLVNRHASAAGQAHGVDEEPGETHTLH